VSRLDSSTSQPLKRIIRHGELDRVPAYGYPQLHDLPGAAKYLEQLDDRDESQIYIGSCHCQAVKFAVKSEPLETAEINDCACSICVGVSLYFVWNPVVSMQANCCPKNGVLWLYPPQRNVYFYPPKSSSITCIPAEGLLNEYTFGLCENGHYICKTCGCEVFEARVVSFFCVFLLNADRSRCSLGIQIAGHSV